MKKIILILAISALMFQPKAFINFKHEYFSVSASLPYLGEYTAAYNHPYGQIITPAEERAYNCIESSDMTDGAICDCLEREGLNGEILFN